MSGAPRERTFCLLQRRSRTRHSGLTRNVATNPHPCSTAFAKVVLQPINLALTDPQQFKVRRLDDAAALQASGCRFGRVLVWSSAPRPSDLPPLCLDPEGQETDILTSLNADDSTLRLRQYFAESRVWNVELENLQGCYTYRTVMDGVFSEHDRGRHALFLPPHSQRL